MVLIELDRHRFDISHADIRKTLYDAKTARMFASGELCFINLLLLASFVQAKRSATVRKKNSRTVEEKTAEGDRLVAQHARDEKTIHDDAVALSTLHRKIDDQASKISRLEADIARLSHTAFAKTTASIDQQRR